MKAEIFFYILSIVGTLGLFTTILYFETNETIEPIETVDFNVLNERFDRLETGIINSTIDVCFASGGKWLNDGNELLWIDLVETVEVSLCARPKTKT